MSTPHSREQDQSEPAPEAQMKAFRRILPPFSRRRHMANVMYQRFFPKGTRRWRWISNAMVPAWEARNAAIRTRNEWRNRRENKVELGSYGLRPRDWFSRLPPNQETLAAQRNLFNAQARPIHVLVIDDGGDLGVTESSLRGQTWELAQILPVSPEGLAEEFSRLAQDHPNDLVVILRAGDQLRLDALFEISQVTWRDPSVQLVYWDDDLAEVAGVWDWFVAGLRRGVYSYEDLHGMGDPRVKPGWSPDLLGCVNYIGRAFAIRARHLHPEIAARHQSSGLDDDSMWWDVLLSLDADQEQVSHLSAVIQAMGTRYDQVTERHLELVDRWFARQGWPAKAELGPSGVIPVWEPDQLPSVSVIIPTYHNRKLVADALDLIRVASYPRLQVIIVDNGGRTADNEAWYSEKAGDLPLEIIWWDEPFNYSAVNNRAAAQATGEVLVFLNDDTAPGDPGWLAHLSGWAHRLEIGVVGLQLIDDNRLIQHGGVVVGMHGFADHLFQGMTPHSDSLVGPTDWTRNALAVTGACLAVRQSVFEEVGGFDERLELCGSDVILGLRARQAGYRNVVSAATPVRHRESATRGRHVPANDVFASYWAYQRWLMGGDPYFSSSLSVDHPEPTFRLPSELGVLERLTHILERPMEVFRQRNDADEARTWALISEAGSNLPAQVAADHQKIKGRQEVKTVNWFVPEFQNPFYGGIHTAFRLANHLAVDHGVENRFMVIAGPEGHDKRWYRSGLVTAFPSLSDSPIVYHNSFAFNPEDVPPADVAMATMWTTAYFVARTPKQARRFYLIQDYEPMFNPAGTLYALAEHSYRLGLYGLCNTGHLAEIYENRYGGAGSHFWPAVDDRVFHDRARLDPDPDRPVTVFLYARPGHTRNCWELAARALHLVKSHLGDEVRIVTAGSWTSPDGTHGDLLNLGQLDYHETGALYRTCDIGIALTVSEHPSYLPLELMACGVAVVAFDNPAGNWLLRDDHNCVRTPQTADGLAEEIIALAQDPARRQRLAKQGRDDITAHHASWDQNLAGVYEYLCDPESRL